MKTLVLSAIIGTVLVAALPQGTQQKPVIDKTTVPGLKVVPKPLYDKLFNANGKLISVLSNPPNGNHPQSKVPEVQLENPKVFTNTVRRKVRYGPYRLPPTSENNWQKQAMKLAGMADEYHYNVTKPCKECILASLSADLEYADGSVVPSASAWLHHSALVVQGSRIFDPVCGESNTETPFSSGNERSTVRFYSPESPTKFGYRIHADDTMTIVGEYKNEIDREQWVWLALSFELFDGPQPEFRNSHVIWMSTIGSLNCDRDMNQKNPYGASNLTSQGVPKTLAFSEKSMPWTSPINGTIVAMGGHLHDGGISVEFFKNGQKLCESTAQYKSGGTGGMGSHSTHAGGEHVSGMSGCKVAIPIKEQDRFWLAANYNFTLHEGSKTENGDLDEVMGVGTVMVLT